MKTISAEVVMECGYRLALIDQKMYEGGTKEELEVNRKGRKVPHYSFIPSHHHPDPNEDVDPSKRRIPQYARRK